MRRIQSIAHAVAVVGQLGFTIITPPLVLVWVANRLVSAHGWGAWVLIAAILIGLGCSVSGAWSFLRSLRTQQQKKDAPPRGACFNRHI